MTPQAPTVDPRDPRRHIRIRLRAGPNPSPRRLERSVARRVGIGAFGRQGRIRRRKRGVLGGAAVAA